MEFHSELASNVNRNDIVGANDVLMKELGKVAVHHRPDFIALLKTCEVPAHESFADQDLVNMYFENLPKKELLIGTSFLVNMHNKKAGFDGEPEISDEGVKASYKVMTSYFYGQDAIETSPDGRSHYRNTDWKNGFDGTEEKSNLILGALAGIGNKVLESRNKKKFGALDALKAKQYAKAEMIKSMAAERKIKADADAVAKAEKSKMMRIGLIAGGVVLLGVIGVIIYKMKTK